MPPTVDGEIHKDSDHFMVQTGTPIVFDTARSSSLVDDEHRHHLSTVAPSASYLLGSSTGTQRAIISQHEPSLITIDHHEPA